ncbi:hypothetical protein VWZ88_08030 [Phaeobacter sp. JH20_36]|uniref:hypothetical protein n=1 Tax=unclassified Phaeobacter TaxID=2621772 RepID=UPI003A83D622
MATGRTSSVMPVAGVVGNAGCWPELGWRPDAALRMFGMRRSGNHAVANWLQRNAPHGQALFFNNCKSGRAPLAHHQGVERNAVQLARYDTRDLAGLGATLGAGGLLLISYEDTVPSDFGLERPVSGDLDETLLSGDILLLRGFLNWSASLLKKLQRNPDFTVAHRSASVLRAIDSYRKMLELVAEADDLALTVIDYDVWIHDAEYRSALLDRLGLPCVDNTLGKVQRYGGGSSFDTPEAGADFDLRTDQRWQRMSGDAEYQAILHIAARDTALLAALSRHYPHDAKRLASLADQTPIAAGGLR